MLEGAQVYDKKKAAEAKARKAAKEVCCHRLVGLFCHINRSLLLPKRCVVTD
jgi:hypothetical protein